MIPFSPPRIDQLVIDEVVDTLKSGWITTGPKTMRFEDEITAYCGNKATVCLSSATAGLQLILSLFGVKKGDEVIVPAYTYCATGNVVNHSGAKLVLVDVNHDDFNINIENIKKAITKNTKVIMPVDIGGLPCDYEALHKVINSPEIKEMFTPNNELQEKLGRILILSDSAHSFGGSTDGVKAGALTDISVFSFHAVKNLSTAEGGAVALNLPDGFDNEELRKQLKTKSLHGQNKDALSKMKVGGWKYDVIESGFKCNMTDIQAAMGLVELGRYEGNLARRKAITYIYNEAFTKKDWALTPNFTPDNKISSYHLYMLRINNISEETRDKIIAEISENQVAVNVHFQPLPLLTAFKSEFKMSDYPVAFNNYACEISLPVYFNLTDEQAKTVIDTVVSAVEKFVG